MVYGRTFVDHGVVELQPALHEAKGLPETGPCFAPVYRLVSNDPDQHAAGLHHGHQRIGYTVEVETMSAVLPQIVVRRARQD